MTKAKPLDPGCVGGIFCPVRGHVVQKVFKNGRFKIAHIPLTKGQRQTITRKKFAAMREAKDRAPVITGRPMPDLTPEQAQRIATAPKKPWSPPADIEGVW